jgi:hypothetical protein
MKTKQALGALSAATLAFLMLSAPAAATAGGEAATPADPSEGQPLGGNVLWECACAAACPGGTVAFAEPICDTAADVKKALPRAVSSCVAHASQKCHATAACDCQCTTKGKPC